MAKIALTPSSRVLAEGEGWRVAEVVCTSGPEDRPYEERHQSVSIAVVAGGTFEYRSTAGRALLTPGALMLGSPGQSFECRHDHGTGDHCLAFWYAPGYFERIAAEATRTPRRRPAFGALRVPPLRALASTVARACRGLQSKSTAWEELAVELAARAAQAVDGVAPPGDPLPSAMARVSRAVRAIEADPDAPWPLSALAREARLSPYHFLRTFMRVTGVTPHQFLLRLRLRAAALRVLDGETGVLDAALDSGFGDVSNFNRAFRGEFGLSPRAYRRAAERSAGDQRAAGQ